MAPKPAAFLPLQHCAEHSAYDSNCATCRIARRLWDRRRRKLRTMGRPALIPVRGTQRRIQAMYVMGYGPAAIARRLGMHSKGNVQRLVYAQRVISRDMADRVEELFNEWGYSPAPVNAVTKVIRTKAIRRGYVSAMAWDDIDNDKAPTGVERQGRLSAADRLAEYGFLRSTGMSKHECAQRLGVQVYTLDNLVREAAQRAAQEEAA
jgi:plasmid maintenance system antidote protein VapI